MINVRVHSLVAKSSICWCTSIGHDRCTIEDWHPPYSLFTPLHPGSISASFVSSTSAGAPCTAPVETTSSTTGQQLTVVVDTMLPATTYCVCFVLFLLLMACSMQRLHAFPVNTYFGCIMQSLRNGATLTLAFHDLEENIEDYEGFIIHDMSTPIPWLPLVTQ